MKKIITVCFVLLCSSRSYGGVATEPTQITVLITFIGQTLKQVEQLSEQVNGYKMDMDRYNRALAESVNLPASTLNDFVNTLKNLQTTQDKLDGYLDGINEYEDSLNLRVTADTSDIDTETKASAYRNTVHANLRSAKKQNEDTTIEYVDLLENSSTESEDIDALIIKLEKNLTNAETQSEVAQVANQILALNSLQAQRISEMFRLYAKRGVGKRTQKSTQDKLILEKNKTFFYVEPSTPSKPHKTKKLTDY